MLAQAWSDLLTVTEEKRYQDTGKAISCTKGCSACCNQLVPISPAEAFLIRDLVRAKPPGEREALAVRFQAITQAVSEAALASGNSLLDTDAYFDLGLPCPFLVDASCSIHERRPLVCREYLVLSPAGNCASFPNPFIRILPLPYQVREALSRLVAELMGRMPERIPLHGALDWAEEHAEWADRRWDSEKVAQALAYHLFSI